MTETSPTARSSTLDPAWFFVLFAVAVPLSPEFSVLGFNKVRLTDLLLMPTLLTFMGAAATSKGKRSRFDVSTVAVPMAAVLLWGFARLYVIEGPEPLRDGQLQVGTNYLLKRGIYFLIFFLGMLVARTPGRLHMVMSRFYLAAPIMNVVLLVQYWQNSSAGEQGYRASGFVGNQPNSTAMFIVANIAIAMCILPAAESRRERIALILSCVTGAAALLTTGSREGLLCLVLVIAMVAGIHRQLTPVNVVMCGVAALAVYSFGPQGIRDRLDSIPYELSLGMQGVSGETDLNQHAGHSSVAARITVFLDTLDTVVPRSPLVGFGTAYYTLGILDNTYLTELVYNGLVGFLLYAWLLVGLVGLINRGLRVRGDEFTRCYSHAISVMLVAVLVSGFALEIFWVIRPMEAFFLFAGLLAGQVSQFEDESDAAWSRRLKAAASLAREQRSEERPLEENGP